MKLLLDTHIWIWAIHSPEKLGRRVRRELQRAGNELYLSPVSIWEAHHLVRRKRLRIRQDFAQWLDDVMAQVPLREAPFTFAVAGSPEFAPNSSTQFLGTMKGPNPDVRVGE